MIKNNLTNEEYQRLIDEIEIYLFDNAINLKKMYKKISKKITDEYTNRTKDLSLDDRISMLNEKKNNNFSLLRLFNYCDRKKDMKIIKQTYKQM